jgi:flagellar export protein FliJ
VKRFQFRLDKLRRIREQRLQQKQIALAQAVHFEQQVDARTAAILAVMAQQKQGLRQALSAPQVPLDKVIATKTYEGVLASAERGLVLQKEQIQAVIAGRRRELVEADRDVKILDNLSDRQRQRFNDAVEKVDALLMDELAAQAALRRAQVRPPRSE